MQQISTFMEVRRHLLLESVKVNSDWAVLFTDFVNLFTLFVLIFCATTTYLIRSFCKATTYIDSYISTLIISTITLLFILFFLEASVLEPSFLTTSNLFFAQAPLAFSSIVFFSLFLLITPVTLVLLSRSEKLSIFFCILNFIFLLIVVIFIVSTNSIIGLVMGYELVFIPSFFIMRRTVYSSSALSAYSVFTV